MRPVAIAAALLFATLAAGSARAEPSAPPPDRRLVCRGGERQLGTHMRTRRRCRTAEEWRRDDEASARLPITLQTTEGQNDGRAPAQPRS